MLESLQQTNIGNLNLEEPKIKLDLPFDVERDVRASDWTGMKDMLERMHTKEEVRIIPENFADMAIRMKILFPEKVSELNLNEYDFIQLDASRRIARIDPEQRATYLMRMKFLFPERVSELDVPDYEWEEMKFFCELMINNAPGRALVMTSEMFIFDPSSIQKLGILNRSFYEKAEKEATSLFLKSKLKILFPKEEVIITSENWREFNQDLELCRRKDDDWWPFAQQAACMKIVAAKEVVVTPEGLEFIPPDTEIFKVSTPALPEVRKF